MRIGVFSDSHGHIDLLLEAIRHAGELDGIIHCGDCYNDLEEIKNELQCPIYGVVGNVDYVQNAPKEKLLEIGGFRLYVSHGHLFDVKYDYQRIFYKGLEVSADVVIFGHTHIPLVKSFEGMTLFNPGSVGRPRPGQRSSYGLIEIEHNILNCRTIAIG